MNIQEKSLMFLFTFTVFLSVVLLPLYCHAEENIDLIVEDIWTITSPLNIDEWETIKFRIKNQGTNDASAQFYTKLWIGEALIYTGVTGGLSAGGTATGSVNFKVSNPGVHQVKVEVDILSEYLTEGSVINVATADLNNDEILEIIAAADKLHVFHP